MYIAVFMYAFPLSSPFLPAYPGHWLASQQQQLQVERKILWMNSAHNNIQMYGHRHTQAQTQTQIQLFFFYVKILDTDILSCMAWKVRVSQLRLHGFYYFCGRLVVCKNFSTSSKSLVDNRLFTICKEMPMYVCLYICINVFMYIYIFNMYRTYIKDYLLFLVSHAFGRKNNLKVKIIDFSGIGFLFCAMCIVFHTQCSDSYVF